LLNQVNASNLLRSIRLRILDDVFLSSFKFISQQHFLKDQHMKTLMANEAAFVSGGEADGGSCPAAGVSGGCYAPVSSGCTTTTTNGLGVSASFSVSIAGPTGSITVTSTPSTTTCPTAPIDPRPGQGGNPGGGGSNNDYLDWLRNTPIMASGPWLVVTLP
jgi:hypothetical protein